MRKDPWTVSPLAPFYSADRDEEERPNMPSPPTGERGYVHDPASVPALPRDPVRAGKRHLRHRRRLDGERHQILRLQIMDMVLAAGARDGLRLERHDFQII